MFHDYVTALQWKVPGIRLLVLVCLCLSACFSQEQGEPRLELSLQKFDSHSREVIIQLVVTNRGDHPLTIPHLTAERGRHYRIWGGWFFRIHRKNEDRWYGLYSHTGRRTRHFTRKDLMTLAQGNSSRSRSTLPIQKT